MHYVYSTITNDTKYCHYVKGGADLPTLIKTVLISGGATRGGKGLITPHGVGTQVGDSDLEFLESNEAFKRHKAAGFIKVIKAQKDANIVARDMTPNDKSSPVMVKSTTGKEAAAVGSADAITEKAVKKAKG